MKKLLAPLFALVIFLLPLSANADAMEFSFPDRQGNMHSLSDFRGKYVFVDFWASWCVPCRKQTPHLKAFEKNNHYDNLAIIGVSLDDDSDAWEDALDEDEPLGLQLLCEENFDHPLATDLDIYAIPRFVLFGPNGELVDGDMPMPNDDNFKATIEKYIGTAH